MNDDVKERPMGNIFGGAKPKTVPMPTAAENIEKAARKNGFDRSSGPARAKKNDQGAVTKYQFNVQTTDKAFFDHYMAERQRLNLSHVGYIKYLQENQRD